MNVLLTAPHGGWTYQDDWPLRKHGCYDANLDACTFDSDPAACPEEERDGKECRAVFLPDSYTKKMTKWVAEGMEALGYKPHVLINNVRR